MFKATIFLFVVISKRFIMLSIHQWLRISYLYCFHLNFHPLISTYTKEMVTETFEKNELKTAIERETVLNQFPNCSKTAFGEIEISICEKYIQMFNYV